MVGYSCVKIEKFDSFRNKTKEYMDSSYALRSKKYNWI